MCMQCVCMVYVSVCTYMCVCVSVCVFSSVLCACVGVLYVHVCRQLKTANSSSWGGSPTSIFQLETLVQCVYKCTSLWWYIYM